MSKIQKTFLLSLDGWGISKTEKGNAVFHAQTPHMDALAAQADEYAEINASGLYVGLPEGVMGNSEVGHLTMGAGRPLYTDLVKINKAISSGDFYKNERMLEAFETAKQRGSNLHFLGLLSDGGVHSHIDHLFEFLKAAKANGVSQTFVHAFMDGRDTPPNSGTKYIEQLLAFLEETQSAKLSTIIGRFYAMDRDKRWERIEKAYALLVKGVGEKADHDTKAISAILKRHYDQNIFDETMLPICVLPADEGKIADGDVLIFIDYRSDRMRQIVETFGVKPPFHTGHPVKDLKVFQMTQYSSKFDLPILYPPDYVSNSLSEWISKKRLRQFHTAETEKYAHVTFFFNGRTEEAFELETRKLIDSPKVRTYDMQPEMSMPQVTDTVKAAMQEGYDFIMCNFAPPDMVGHTGNYEATVKACEATDVCIGECIEAAKRYGYVMVITSDHGNAEEMLDEHGQPKTSHNCNLVPLAVISLPGSRRFKIKGCETSSLQDVAPTVCEIMGIDCPKEFVGKSLVVS